MRATTGILLTLTLAVAVPVVVVEDKGPLAAMGRSATLTDGHRVGVFMAMLVVVVVFLLIQPSSPRTSRRACRHSSPTCWSGP